ncbi:hypothetical protein NDU88_000936 [Pleurodeles waltl]|uniref:Uncharacterized protein n=1 Tax=Pleurodeles waltl TaxID=8319 RepID=A0AAV7Q5H3_PLEWA|nr:hypothetical protein NDU88_000936 [Pleurodeles waltl]
MKRIDETYRDEQAWKSIDAIDRVEHSLRRRVWSDLTFTVRSPTLSKSDEKSEPLGWKKEGFSKLNKTRLMHSTGHFCCGERNNSSSRWNSASSGEKGCRGVERYNISQKEKQNRFHLQLPCQTGE